mmetsp:Transcript_37907/g.83116  ORF Transcript_37907/g.83116 Transcript_37907/m.83116 type:complete len:177 (-) Transcript_37907:50-580(-)
MSDQQPQDVGEHVSLHHLTDPHLRPVITSFITSLGQYARLKEGEKQQVQESFQQQLEASMAAMEARIQRVEANEEAMREKLSASEQKLAASEQRHKSEMTTMRTRLSASEQRHESEMTTMRTRLSASESEIAAMSNEISRLNGIINKHYNDNKWAQFSTGTRAGGREVEKKRGLRR